MINTRPSTKLLANMLIVTTTQFLLNPSIGKSAKFVAAGSAATRALNLKRFQAPEGSLVCDTPTRIAVLLVCASETAATSQRSLYGSYCTRGSNGPIPPVGAQNVFIDTMLTCAPVDLFWI